MTASTRSRLMVCAIVGLITIPAEALLLPVAKTPNAAEAAIEWTASLDTEELRAAAAEIEAYPVHYRRAIMGALSPEDRSDAWRLFFENYLTQHPELTGEQVAVIRDVHALATADVFRSTMSPELKTRIGDVFAKAQKVLGATASNELFVTLGPKQMQRASALPYRQQLADRVRAWRTVSADAGDCNCNIEIDTCDLLPDSILRCSELFTCDFDLRWPMCGPLWSWACTGWCRLARIE